MFRAAVIFHSYRESARIVAQAWRSMEVNFHADQRIIPTWTGAISQSTEPTGYKGAEHRVQLPPRPKPSMHSSIGLHRQFNTAFWRTTATIC
jgi:hypothetical protein